jgi:hypothetical protein
LEIWKQKKRESKYQKTESLLILRLVANEFLL